MNEYELEFVSEGVSVERCLEFVTRLNKAEELKQKAYQLLESVRKTYGTYPSDKTLKIYEDTLDWYMTCDDTVDSIIKEIESEGGVID